MWRRAEKTWNDGHMIGRFDECEEGTKSVCMKNETQKCVFLNLCNIIYTYNNFA
jgi:hypothetical protein